MQICLLSHCSGDISLPPWRQHKLAGRGSQWPRGRELSQQSEQIPPASLSLCPKHTQLGSQAHWSEPIGRKRFGLKNGQQKVGPQAN